MTTDLPEDTQIVAKFRMTTCNATKAGVFIKDPETGEQRTEMRESIEVQAQGMKDALFGPATPSASLRMTIQNPNVARLLRKAFEKHFLEAKDFSSQDQYGNEYGSTGVELEVLIRVKGPAPVDTYS